MIGRGGSPSEVVCLPNVLLSKLDPLDNVAVMKLFDDSRPCVNSAEPNPNLSNFASCNSDWFWGDNLAIDNSSVRDHCEQWFQGIPEGKRADLRGEFRSSDDSAHNGAFFELFLHELLMVLGCEVEFQPQVRGQTPDFRLGEKEHSIYVEATVAGLKTNSLLPSRNEQKVLNDLNTLRSCEFSLLYEFEGDLKETIGRKFVTKGVSRLLETSDASQVRGDIDNLGLRAAPSVKIQRGDWTLTVWLHPRPAESRPKNCDERIVLGRMNAQSMDPISPVREALKRKAEAYKDLGAPLILALNAANPYFSRDECDFDVLSGDLSLQYGVSAGGAAQYIRQPNGFWFSRRSRAIAGVIIFRNADILNMFQARASLHVSPHYCGPQLPSALLRLPHFIYLDGRPIRKEGENVAQLLGVGLK